MDCTGGLHRSWPSFKAQTSEPGDGLGRVLDRLLHRLRPFRHVHPTGQTLGVHRVPTEKGVGQCVNGFIEVRSATVFDQDLVAETVYYVEVLVYYRQRQYSTLLQGSQCVEVIPPHPAS
eukprot:GHVH01012497.1.p1 GENE.GHVH01012497.1~~GHVH01012497.1.p1  ORF type:complete len:119 (+),score=9.90 GHVH01012497.1:119-475(+)